MRIDNLAQPALSTKEERALSLFAAGRGRAEIAHLMGLSPNTVGHLLTSAKDKLAARSLSHAVAIFVVHRVDGVGTFDFAS